jgi:hypothetical protein
VNIKTTLKSSVAAAALFAIAAPVAPSVNAADDTLSSGNKNSLKLSGYLSRSLFYADDGRASGVFNVDGSTPANESRVRWIAKGTLNENVTAGATIEMELPLSNKESTMRLNTGIGAGNPTETTDSTAWGVRHHVVWVNHKKMGKISLGHTNAASNGRSETTFSGTNMINTSGGYSYGSGLLFIDTTTATTPTISAISIGSSTSNMDGLGRADVLRYDSPRFGGLALATSLTDNSSWDIAADYRAKFGGIRIRVQAQHNNTNAASNAVAGSTSMSAAALHDSGVNGSFAYGQRQLNGDNALVGATVGTGNAGRGNDGKFWYFNVGYRAKLFGVGPTNFSFDWHNSDDVQANGSESEAKGVTVAQMINPIGASIGITYKSYSYDTDTQTFDDIDVIALQTVFNF